MTAPTVGRAVGVALQGITGSVVTVEAFINSGLPAFSLVGLPDAALQEAKHRIKAACASSGQSISADLVTINLSPASTPKTGTGFDVAIAVSILAAKKILAPSVGRVAFIGELGLDGYLRAVRGVLPAVSAALASGYDRFVVAPANEAEARLVAGAEVFAAHHLSDIIARFHATGCDDADLVYPAPALDAPAPCGDEPEKITPPVDFSEVRGQGQARFGMEVAAAGGHNVLLVGAPGAGKTMLAKRFVTLLPPLADTAAQEVTALESIVAEPGTIKELHRQPPFVDPHHTATSAAMIGGGSTILRPGAISMAHHGVLFLDEAPEFATNVLQALREPLEAGTITITRSRSVTDFPAQFQLIMAANPCPCGYALDPSGRCECAVTARRRYLTKLSGPLLDRLDVRIVVATTSRRHLADTSSCETSHQVAQRVQQARAAQRDRWQPWGWRTNAEVPGSHLRGPMQLPAAVRASLDDALDRTIITARGYDRTLRLAWTIADLDNAPQPDEDHIGLAMSLRGQGITL